MIKHGLKPVFNSSTRILILGSLPSDESIQRQEYYGNPGNDFWKLVSAAIDEDITRLDYACKIAKLKEHGIGLWDVLRSSEREGSMDENILRPEMNDFGCLSKWMPKLELICFNGKKAGAHEGALRTLGYKTIILPSSSGANRRYGAERLGVWKAALGGE